MNEDLLINQYPEIVESILLMETSIIYNAPFLAIFHDLIK